MEASPKVNIEVTGHGQIQAHQGERLINALRNADTGILHRCGGQGRCTTCRVTFEANEPSQITAAERSKLEEKGLLGEARLSCQILCSEGMQLTVVQTEQNSGLEAGKAPAEEMEPAPDWLNLQ